MLISFIVIVITLWFYGYKIYPPGSGFSEPNLTQRILALATSLVALIASIAFIISFIKLVWTKIRSLFIKQKDQT